MIPSELIDRLRKCCEWLDEKKIEKFYFDGDTLFFEADDNMNHALIRFEVLGNPIQPDPLCEYPNALHRIVKECFNADLEIKKLEDGTYSVFIFDTAKDEFIVESDTYQSFPLHAEIEATCMAIEERMR